MRPRRYRLKNKWRIGLLFFLVFVLSGVGYLYASGLLSLLMPSAEWAERLAPPGSDEFKGNMHVLLLGIDARKGETTARADTILLASIDGTKKQISVLSIPRDTRVNIPGHGMDKINVSTALGGPELIMRVVSDLVGLPVDYYIATNYEGFKEIVDAVGGVDYNVEKRLYHYDPQDGGIYTIDLKPGPQHLDGNKALQYVRYRSYALGDIDRTLHQQKFLLALADQVMRPATLLKLPELVPTFSRAVETNMSMQRMTALARAAKNMQDYQIVTQTLPGKFLTLNGGSYWAVDPAVAQLAVQKLLSGEKMEVVQGEVVMAQRNTGGSANAAGNAVPARRRSGSKGQLAPPAEAAGPESRNGEPAGGGGEPAGTGDNPAGQQSGNGSDDRGNNSQSGGGAPQDGSSVPGSSSGHPDSTAGGTAPGVEVQIIPQGGLVPN
ncbi:LCP family protein [Desulfurispora thermophila]|uniref:LCP family protein n=1 Tax=Desulfurispora thermophila TaxID=265470 RepID=UPI0003670451|nr:LCP family protein [Desulfurispora thermophila]